MYQWKACRKSILLSVVAAMSYSVTISAEETDSASDGAQTPMTRTELSGETAPKTDGDGAQSVNASEWQDQSAATSPSPQPTPIDPTPSPVAQPPAPQEAQPAPPPAEKNNTDAGKLTNEPIKTRGKFGFGVGLEASVSDLIDVAGGLTLRAWAAEIFALQPFFTFGVGINDEEVFIGISPGLDFLFSVYRGRATRINFGFGFGFMYSTLVDRTSASDNYYNPDDSSSSDTSDASSDVSSDSSLGFGLPLVLQLEHFFTSWFSLYVGARFNLLRVNVQNLGDNPDTNVSLAIDTTSLQLGVIFYQF